MNTSTEWLLREMDAIIKDEDFSMLHAAARKAIKTLTPSPGAPM